MNGSVYISNRAGIPVITTTPVVGTSNVIITLPNHIFRFLGQKVKLLLILILLFLVELLQHYLF